MTITAGTPNVIRRPNRLFQQLDLAGHYLFSLSLLSRYVP